MDFTMDNVTMDNLTNETFNCLARDELSFVNITNTTHWQIAADLQGASVALAVVYIIFFLIAFPWNLFIVITYIVKYKLLKQPGNLFLFNLALADMLVSVTVLMFSFVAQAGKEFVLGFTDVVRCGVCEFSGFSLMFLVFLSFHLLAALSIDRFIHLAFPLRYKNLMSFGRAIVVLVIVWIVSLIVGLLPFVGFGQYEFNRQYGSCLPRFSGRNITSGLLNFYYVIFCVLEALIPIIIIVVTNVFTYRLVAKFLRRNIRRRRTFRNPEAQASNTEEERTHKKQQTQLVRVFGALCIANCVSWTPVIAVVLSIAAFGAITMSVEDVPNAVYVFGWICYLFNPVVHPIIESFFVKDLRYQVKRARRTIRRASTAVIRTTTQKFFNSTALDKANEAVESGTPTGGSKRVHKFFNKKMVDKKLRENESSYVDSSMHTDEILMDEMSRGPSRTNTPSPDRTRKILGKVGRSVTFSENNTSSHLPSPPPEGGVMKSALKRNSDPVVGVSYQKIALKEVGEVISEVEEENEVSEDSLPENGTKIHIQDEHMMNGTVTTGMESNLSNGTEEVCVDFEDSNLANGEASGMESNHTDARSTEPEQVHIDMNNVNEAEISAETESNLPNGTDIGIDDPSVHSDSLPRTIV